MKLPDSYDRLKQWFQECPYAVTAFSGGVDSSLVAYLAHHFLGDRAVAVISASPSLKLRDLDGAKAFCLGHGIKMEVIVTEELKNPDYFLNPVNRCFYCKKTLYTELEQFAAGIDKSWILNGTNVDDQGDYRPGLEAAAAFRVRSPLVDCGLSKEAVRELARALDLECWDKPAAPCLSSRIPYGQRVTEEKLRRIEEGEAILQQAGFPIVRLRHVENGAVVEVPSTELDRLRSNFPDVEQALLKLGFDAVNLDEEGFVSGKLNRSIPGVT